MGSWGHSPGTMVAGPPPQARPGPQTGLSGWHPNPYLKSWGAPTH